MNLKKTLAVIICVADICAMATAPVYATEITSADVSNGEVIAFDKGKITITSDAALEELKSGLTLTKADGTAIKGHYYVSGNGDGAYDVNFGNLEDGQEYIMSYGSYNLNFTAKNGINEDFDDWTAADLEALKSDSGRNGLYFMEKENYATGIPTISLKQDANGGQYLDIDGKNDSTDRRFRLYASDLGKLKDNEGNIDYLELHGDWKWYESGNPDGFGRPRDDNFKRLTGLGTRAVLHDDKEGLTGIKNDKNQTAVADWYKITGNGSDNKVGSVSVGNTFNPYKIAWKVNDLTKNYEIEVTAAGQRIGISGALDGKDYDSVLLAYIQNHQSGHNASVAVDNLKLTKVTAPRILKAPVNDAVYSGTGTMKIAFTTDIKENTVNTANITLSGIDGENRVTSVTYDAAERTAIVEYSDLKEGSATLSVAGIESAGTATSTNAFRPIMTAKTITLNVTQDPTAPFEFNCLNTDLKETTNLDVTLGKIALTFNDIVDASTVRGITVKDENGSSASNLDIEANQKTVTLKFGTLNPGVWYTITVPSTVKSKDGVLVTPAEFKFKTKSDYAVDLDFENYNNANNADIDFENPGANVHPNTNEGLTFTSEGQSGSTANVYVLNDNGNKFLRMYAHECINNSGKDNFVYTNITLDGTNSVNMKWKTRIIPYDGVASKDTDYNIQYTLNDRVVGRYDTTPWIYTGDSINLVRGEVNEWMEIECVYTPDSTGKYTVYLYYNGEKKRELPIDAKAPISPVRLIKIFNKTDNAVAVDLDDLKVKELVAPYVLQTTYKDNLVPVTAQFIDLYFNEAMDAETVIDTNIKLYNGDKEAEIAGMYVASGNYYRMELADYLTPDTEYTVKFEKVRSTAGISAEREFKFITGSTGVSYVTGVISETDGGAEISKIPASGNVYANIQIKNTTGQPDKVSVIIAAYDDSGKLTALTSTDTDITADSEPQVCKGSVTGVAGARTVKVFVWKNLTEINPILLNPVTLTK